MARSKTSNFFVWIIIGLLFIGLLGFGAAGGLTGSISSVGTVGNKDIDLQDYANQLTQEIRAYGAQSGQAVTFPQAQAIGLDQVVLQRLVATSALDNEASQIGLSVGDDRVRDQVLEIPAFRGPSGTFDREAYRFALSQQGLTEAEFETGLREEIARTILQGAVVSGVAAPAVYAEVLADYVGETRDFSWSRLDQTNLDAPLAEPTQDDLTSYYQANTPDFTTPETKAITFAWLLPDMIIDDVEVDEVALREAYDLAIDDYVQPERRLVERLIYPDSDQAEAAKIRLESGEVDFDALVAERGLDLADIDLGDVIQAQLGAAGSAVFNADTGMVVGPFDTDLGPALFRNNAILAVRETSFEQAMPALREQLAADRARRVIDDASSDIDDLLVGGATLDEIANETDMQLGTINWFEGSGETIAAYNAFQLAARTATTTDFPEIIRTDDGGIFALRVDEIIAPAVAPIADVMPKVIAGWETQATEDALTAQAEVLAASLGEGRSASSLGLNPTAENTIRREGFVAGLPPETVTVIYDMQPGDTEIVNGFGAVLIVQLDSINPSTQDDPERAARIELLSEQAQQGIAQDLLDIYARAIQLEAGVSLNYSALNAVHTQFQGGGGYGN